MQVPEKEAFVHFRAFRSGSVAPSRMSEVRPGAKTQIGGQHAIRMVTGDRDAAI